MDRLTPIDDTFIAIERDELPMHIGSLLIFDGPAPDFSMLLEHIEGRLDQLPRYRQRIRSVPLNLGYPVWLDDPNFEIQYHIRHTALPPPGDEAKLTSMAARQLSHRLDMDRSPWEIWFIEGLSDDRFALLFKVHHSMVDGLSGAEMVSTLLDDSPQRAEIKPSQWAPEPEPSATTMVGTGLVDSVQRPARRVRELLRGLKEPHSALQKALATGAGTLKLGQSVSHFDHHLMGKPGPHIRWAWANGSLSEVKAIKNELGGTVNDVVLSVVAGGYRALLRSRGVQLSPTDTIRTMIPVSTRNLQTEDSGNAVAVMFADLPIGIADPLARYATVRREMASVKHSGILQGTISLIDNASLLPAMLYSAGGRVVSHATQPAVGTVTTNVPGPQIPLYLQGHLLRQLYPYVPLGMNQLTTVAIMSYNGEINCGVSADFTRVPDLEVLAQGIEAALAELQ